MTAVVERRDAGRRRADGTLEWDETTLVLVEAAGGGETGIGWTYGAAAAAKVVEDELAPVVGGRARSTCAAPFHVQIPRGHVCCGRPLYDYGFLGLARRYLRRTLAALREEIRTGIPIVGVEPSCVAVFRDELVKVLPDDEDAKRLCKETSRGRSVSDPGQVRERQASETTN